MNVSCDRWHFNLNDSGGESLEGLCSQVIKETTKQRNWLLFVRQKLVTEQCWTKIYHA